MSSVGKQAKQRTMLVAGVMSGTSADGVDVAVCHIGPAGKSGSSPRIRLIGTASTAYPRSLREALLRVMEGATLSAAEMSRLNWKLGGFYAGCVARAAEKLGVKIALVGCHGQTVHHETAAVRVFGSAVRSTWQIGEAAVIAERLRCPVVSDFRPADLAAGGQGAPLVPMLDWCLFRSPRVNRVLQNLGGIGNLTAIPAGASADSVLAFDTGPGNMVIDACMSALYGKKYDRDGAVARRGHVLDAVVRRVLREPYFAAVPPKSCGREEFGAGFTTRFSTACRKAGAADADMIATATALTAESVLDAWRRFVQPHLDSTASGEKAEFIVAGGGAKNATLITMLRDGLKPLGIRVRTMDELGVPVQAKEGVAFALMAWLTWHGLPGNVPAATGASRPVVLGKVSFG